jgi:hypothetical protein
MCTGDSEATRLLAGEIGPDDPEFGRVSTFLGELRSSCPAAPSADARTVHLSAVAREAKLSAAGGTAARRRSPRLRRVVATAAVTAGGLLAGVGVAAALVGTPFTAWLPPAAARPSPAAAPSVATVTPATAPSGTEPGKPAPGPTRPPFTRQPSPAATGTTTPTVTASPTPSGVPTGHKPSKVKPPKAKHNNGKSEEAKEKAKHGKKGEKPDKPGRQDLADSSQAAGPAQVAGSGKRARGSGSPAQCLVPGSC